MLLALDKIIIDHFVRFSPLPVRTQPALGINDSRNIHRVRRGSGKCLQFGESWKLNDHSLPHLDKTQSAMMQSLTIAINRFKLQPTGWQSSGLLLKPYDQFSRHPLPITIL